jgi:IPT/TIG domain
MRLACVLLMSLLTLACGAGSGAPSRGLHAAFAFTPPAIAALSPNSQPVNSAPFAMTVTGTNFGTDAVVFWNGNPQQTMFVSSTQLLVAITDTDLLFTGLVHVFVRSGGMNSNTVDFDVAPQ